MSRQKCCGKCHEVKDVECDFSVVKHRRRLADGTIKVYEYPSAHCNECNAKRVAAWKNKKRAEGRYKAVLKRWEKNRNANERRLRQREWYRMMRGEDLHHVWKKYADEPGSRVGMIYLDAQQLAAYFDQFKTVNMIGDSEVTRINGIRLSETEIHQIGRWRRGTTKRIELQIADHWAAKFDLPLWEIEEAAKIAV